MLFAPKAVYVTGILGILVLFVAAGAAGDAPPTGTLIGEYRLAKNAIVDGDTIKVEGIDGSLRLLSIDTEETFKNKKDLRAASADFEKYLETKRRGSGRPPKAATPMGEEGKNWAKKFFEGVKTVRLERDNPKEIRGRYGRLLAYVFVNKNGQWVNYNVESVRAGMSPYFSKYSYSRRFHDEFVQAESQARAAKRGIWSADAEGYGDYPKRKVWWDARADYIQAFEAEAKGRDDYIVLTNWDSLSRLKDNIGKQVTILATVGSIQRKNKLVRVLLGRRQFEDFPVIFFSQDVFNRSGIGRHRGEFVTVRGKVSVFKRGNYQEVQVVVRHPGQVALSPIPSTSDAQHSKAN